MTGYTGSTDFPTTSGAYDTSYNGSSDVFVSKLDGNLSPDTTAPSGSVTINSNDTYTNTITVTMNLTAVDDVGVTGYYASETSTAPSANTVGWVAVTSAYSLQRKCPVYPEQ